MLLTIGMIVKNEEENLVKCLDSLKPIREALETELIIVDTGSTDGTVEIARRYADEVRRFEWIKDFAAARNASLEGAKGEWFMFVDADEYFEDCSDLIKFFKSGDYRRYSAASYIQRNYGSEDDEMRFVDLNVTRLAKILRETKFVKPIHEYINTVSAESLKMLNSYVRHYGYSNAFVDMAGKAGRNIEILLKELEKDPDDYMTQLQLAESYIHTDPEKSLETLKDSLKRFKAKNHAAVYIFYGKLAASFLNREDYGALSELLEDFFRTRGKSKSKTLGVDIEINAINGVYLNRIGRYEESAAALKIYQKLYREYSKGMHRTPEIFAYAMQYLNDYNYLNSFITSADCHIRLKKYNMAAESLKNAPIDRFLKYSETGMLKIRLLQEFEIMRATGGFGGLPALYERCAGTPEAEKFFAGIIVNGMKSSPGTGDGIFKAFADYFGKFNLNETDLAVCLRLSELAALLAGGIVQPDAEKTNVLFNLYADLSRRRLSALYKPEILNDEYIICVPESDCAGYYCVKAREARNEGNAGAYLSYLRKAVEINQKLKPFAEAEAEAVRTETARKSEFELLSEKLKQNIYALIDKGDYKKASETLAAYAGLNPSDKEISVIKAKLMDIAKG